MSSAGEGSDGRRILAGRYRLEEVIGRGGMSTVYRGTDLSLDRIVAVKVAMDPLLERDPVYASRFKREARAAAGISNSGVVTVFDAGADGPTRYIVMEYVEGQDLAAILREERPLEPTRAADIAEQVAGTLAAAHAAGIVHRDIKPGNIMVTPEGRAKVLDFGIARTSDGVSLTQTASVLGTAPYMSPEQAMGQPADARSDIYSLGCVLYEMLTGKPPFMGDLPAAVLHQHVRVAPKPPSALNPDVPPALDALVLEMLAKSPADRPQTAAEVRDRLATLESATEATKPLPAAPVPPAPTVAQPLLPAPEPVPPTAPVSPRKRGSGPWVVFTVIAVLLLGAAVAYAVTSGDSGKSGSGSSSAHSAPPVTHVSTTTPPTSTTQSTSTSASTPTTSSTSTPTSTSTTTTTTTTPSTKTPTTTITTGTTSPLGASTGTSTTAP